MIEHFRAVAGETERTVIVYNVPYRTGVNLSNDDLLAIAATAPNVRAVKDSSGNIVQSIDLLQRAQRPRQSTHAHSFVTASWSLRGCPPGSAPNRDARGFLIRGVTRRERSVS